MKYEIANLGNESAGPNFEQISPAFHSVDPQKIIYQAVAVELRDTGKLGDYLAASVIGHFSFLRLLNPENR